MAHQSPHTGFKVQLWLRQCWLPSFSWWGPWPCWWHLCSACCSWGGYLPRWPLPGHHQLSQTLTDIKQDVYDIFPVRQHGRSLRDPGMDPVWICHISPHNPWHPRLLLILWNWPYCYGHPCSQASNYIHQQPRTSPATSSTNLSGVEEWHRCLGHRASWAVVLL